MNYFFISSIPMPYAYNIFDIFVNYLLTIFRSSQPIITTFCGSVNIRHIEFSCFPFRMFLLLWFRLMSSFGEFCAGYKEKKTSENMFPLYSSCITFNFTTLNIAFSYSLDVKNLSSCMATVRNMYNCCL